MPLLNELTNPERFRGLKGLIFDCDGVLFDSLDSNRIYYNAILQRLGLEPMTPEQEAYVHAHAVKESLAFIVPPERWREVDAARRGVNYLRDIMPHLRPEPGIFELLERLKRKGYRLGISTNRTTTMDGLADRFGLELYFEPIVTASHYRPKPHPESLHVILNRWGLLQHEVVFVGDSIVDARTAQAAGVPFWSYKNQGLVAEMHVNDFWRMALGMGLGPTCDGGCS